ncbi:hypothetical protein ACIRU2_15830 [Streptomyces sp. NPDC101169]|uniref:hypothetical protein n=1 Tax=Streptomyces sp. NPDC101169 TaxID=3366121 RepID=UPI00382AFF14
MRRAVDAGRLREDFRAHDFVLITRGAMANMTGAGDWRRHVMLLLEGPAAEVVRIMGHPRPGTLTR